MKKLIILSALTILLFNVATAQKTFVSPIFHSLLDEFIEESKKRGIMHLKDSIRKNVKLIIFTTELGYENDMLAESYIYQGKIHISYQIKDEPKVLRWALYHELGHVLKQTEEHTCHQCKDIMSEYIIKKDSRYNNKRVWKKTLDNYFKWLKD